MKHDLKQATFLIPVRIDTPQRLDNLMTIVGYIKQHFDTNIFIGEEDCKQKLDKVHDGYYFKLSYNQEFHRTRLLNNMIRLTNTPIVINHDSDTLVSVDKYIEAYDLILKNIQDFVWPYNGPFIDIPRKMIQSIKMNTFSFKEANGVWLNNNSKGGIIFYNKNKFIEAGMENEKFISWSLDDEERFHRLSKLGYRIMRLEGSMIHIRHFRGVNSCKINPHYNASEAEYNKVCNMSKEQLIEYIRSWKWET